MSFLQIDDTTIYYESKGTGRSLVFIHAGIADSRMWDDQFDYFSKKYQVLRFDLRGFGKSGRSQVEFSHAEDLNKLLNELGIAKGHFIACSLGVSILFDFALQFPEKILSLTLVNGRPFGFLDSTENPSPLATDAERSYNSKDVMKLAEIEALIWFVGRKRTKRDVDSLLFQKVVDMDSIALQTELFHPLKEKILHPDAMLELENLNAPSAYIIGPLDEPNFVLSCKIVAKKIQSEIYYVEKTAHLPNLESPVNFNQILQTFLEKVNKNI